MTRDNSCCPKQLAAAQLSQLMLLLLLLAGETDTSVYRAKGFEEEKIKGHNLGLPTRHRRHTPFMPEEYWKGAPEFGPTESNVSVMVNGTAELVCPIGHVQDSAVSTKYIIRPLLLGLLRIHPFLNKHILKAVKGRRRAAVPLWRPFYGPKIASEFHPGGGERKEKRNYGCLPPFSYFPALPILF